MKKKLLLPALAAGLLMYTQGHGQQMYGITTANTIFTISNVNTPSGIGGPYSVSGVATGMALVALDARPSNGRLYALAYDSTSGMARLYWLSQSGTSFTANAVGTAAAALSLGATNNAAFDFVSSADNQIRIIGRNGTNYMMNADNGTLLSTGSTAIGFASGDIYGTGSTSMAGMAYTNNFFGSDATTQVGYDATHNVLVNFDAGSWANNFNNAPYYMHSIGATTGAVFSSGSSFGMDTWYDTATHNNILFMTGNTLALGTHLYKYNLNAIAGTGLLTDLGAVGSGTMQVRDIAFGMSRDSTSAIMGHLMAGLTFNLRNIVWFDSYRPQHIRRMIRLNGLTAGQNMVAIDYAPNTGMLYGLGYNSTAQTYQLYTIDTISGHATAINSTSGSLNLGSDDGSGNRINVSFRFMPTVANRIRIVGNNGRTNIRLNALTGAIANTDAATQYVMGDANYGGTANISTMAYTGYYGDTSTQAFGFDANTGAMVMYNMDNSASGYGDGGNGYVSTGFNLNTVLSLLLHTSAYNNARMSIGFDNNINMNVGYISSNFIGDSSHQLNYSMLYDMTGMLTAYHKGTAASPTPSGTVGYGIPVKDIALYRTASAIPGSVVNPVTGTSQTILYPNPVIAQTRIVLPIVPKTTVDVQVVDLNGNIARTFSYAPGTYLLDVDLSRLPEGLYSVRVADRARIISENFKVTKVN